MSKPVPAESQRIVVDISHLDNSDISGELTSIAFALSHHPFQSKISIRPQLGKIIIDLYENERESLCNIIKQASQQYVADKKLVEKISNNWWKK